MTSPFLDGIVPLPAPEASRYIWATVTQVSPLRIQVDGDYAPLGITPDTLVSGLAADDRVYCQITNRRLTVLGVSGGIVIPSAAVVATPDTLALRDGFGRTQVATPSAGGDAVNKTYADGLGTALATAATIMRRDGAGRARVVDPAGVTDIDTMGARNAAITAAFVDRHKHVLGISTSGGATITASVNIGPAASGVVYDPSGGWSTANERWTVPATGLYLINAQMKCNGSGMVASGLILLKGTSSLTTLLYGPNSSGAAFSGATLSGVVSLTAGDVIQLRAGATYTLQTDSGFNSGWSAVRVG